MKVLFDAPLNADWTDWIPRVLVGAWLAGIIVGLWAMLVLIISVWRG